MCIFQILLPYASTLKSFDDTNGRNEMWILPTADWSVLDHFTSLETLCVSKSDMSRWSSQLWAKLREMGTVTELALSPLRISTIADAEAFFGLSQLKSLTIGGCNRNRIDPGFDSLALLANLTQLLAVHTPVTSSVSELTGLVRLGLCVGADRNLDLTRTLSGLHLLEDLVLNCYLDRGLSGSVFAPLTGLKSFSLIMADLKIEEDFFPALGSLKSLTSLAVCSNGPMDFDSRQRFCRITLLTTLRELTLMITHLDFFDLLTGVRGYLVEGSFPRLRSLCTGAENLTDGARRELKRKLPCLNHLE